MRTGTDKVKKVPEALNKIVDIVLAYKPKSKKEKKRGKNDKKRERE